MVSRHHPKVDNGSTDIHFLGRPCKAYFTGRTLNCAHGRTCAWFCWMVRDTEDPCIEAGENNVSGRGVQIDLYKMGKRRKGICVPCKFSSKDISREEIINQGDGITLSVRS